MASAAASCFHTSSEMATPVRRYESALTSNSSKSKSAPAARSTLIASGTTSFPAPSQGTTAMCLRRSGLPLAQLVALDLAGHGLRQLGHELDQVRVLVPLQARLAVFLERGHERLAGHGVALGDDEGLDLREPFDFDPDHRALGHRGMLQERRLDLDRRRPQPAHLDHVVGATLVPVEAVRIDAIAIAREEPFSEHRPLGLLMLGPVERERAVAFDVEVAGLTRWYRFPLVVEDLQLITGDRFAARPWPDVVKPVGAIDMEHLCRADAVEDGQPIRFLPAPPNLGGQRLGGGDAVADRRQVAVARALEVEDRVVEGRRREEERRPALLDHVQHCRGCVPPRMEDARCAHPIRKCEVVAESVSVEESCGRESRVVLGDSKHLLGISDARVRDVVLQVHDRFGLPRGARAVEPEGHIVAARRGWIDLFLDRDLPGAEELWRLSGAIDGCLQFLLRGAVDDHDAGERVLDVVVVVLGTLQERVDWNRHRPKSNRTQERGHPARAVVSDYENALLPFDTKLAESPSRPACEAEELSVPGAAPSRINRHLVAAAGVQIAVEEVGGDVVAVRKVEPTHLHEQCSFGPCRMTG